MRPIPAAGHGPDLYLALGDSIAFGFRPPRSRPKPDYDAPSSLVGYPEVLGRRLGLDVMNASCPGETVASMISTTAKSNGCENLDGRGGGYRKLHPLHVRYRGTQLAFAVHLLRSRPTVSLVTLGIGLNDVAICRDSTVDGCASAPEQRAMTDGVTRGVQHVVASLRGPGHYAGPIVLVTYYRLSYSKPDPRTRTTGDLDAALIAVAKVDHLAVADGDGAFRRASAGHDGSPCAAGLTIPLPGGGCDLHPTLEGQEVLADAVRAALGR